MLDKSDQLTVGQALKYGRLLHGQVLEQVYREIALAIREMDTERARLEDMRSVRRNRNRLAVLLGSLIIATIWPYFAEHVMHSTYGGSWTTAIANMGDILITGYALIRRY